MTRRHHAISVQAATEAAPALAQLLALAYESQAMLTAVRHLVPPPLHPLIQAGPWDKGTWCLLVRGNACAAKVRQVVPALQASLNQQGWQVTSIRLKIQV